MNILLQDIQNSHKTIHKLIQNVICPVQIYWLQLNKIRNKLHKGRYHGGEGEEKQGKGKKKPTGLEINEKFRFMRKYKHKLLYKGNGSDTNIVY